MLFNRTQLNSYFDPNVLLSIFFLSNLTNYHIINVEKCYHALLCILLHYFVFYLFCKPGAIMSSVGSDVAWELRGTSIDPRGRHIFS